ncbi:hypothetical protein P389DRAFT_192495 [Cystobasidium minutum MCA 4210]|uniref:uncharacterized protein n=1 Tax=Cystobasidium minutum MCA 4210 TaxID=1397322 RepID=UPI0034CFE33B|eukprot:jgi/Rhomi1/192495/gm1.709_g
MDALVNRPNHVLENQRKLQADPRFIHQKMPRAGLYMRAYMTLFALGLGGALYGTQEMIRGKGKVAKAGE